MTDTPAPGSEPPILSQDVGLGPPETQPSGQAHSHGNASETGHLVEFEVLGDPAAQGSKKAYVIQGKARLTEAAGAKHKQWRTAVAEAARDIATDHPEWTPLDGALGLSVEFRFPMPKSRSKTARTVGRLYKTSAPDIDKLLRALCDGLTAGGLITDDARIVAVEACKVEVVGWSGAIVTICREGAA